MRRILTTLAVTALLVGCQDLNVVNPNEPDRDRVLSQANDVESLIASSFRLWFTIPQDEYPSIPLAAMADNITGGFFDYGVYDVSQEPRVAWNNSSLNTRDGTNRLAWYDTYRALSSVNDGLYALDQGVNLDGGTTVGTRTQRARAFAKLIQGLCLGYLALEFDKAFVVTEKTDLTQLDPINGFLPYAEVRDSAIKVLDEAIAVANQGAFTIPADIQWVNGTELTNQDIVKLANSFAARFLAYTPRTPVERAAVNWTEVLQRAAAGITTDLAPDGALDIVEGNYRRLLARVRTRPGDHIRPDMMALGPADISGGFQTWYATPSADRQPWQMNTPDKRIVGATQSAPGKYVAYNKNSIWAADRGTYRYSWYYYLRSGAGESWYTGPQPTMTVTEMDLIRAEALIRLNRAAEAIPFINNSRVVNGQLPAILTVDGPPDESSCVPRKFNGQCGSLWDALRYEKNLELMGIEGGIAWYDGRGWGALQEGTPIHMPVPGRELDNLGLPNYTFGGVGGDGAAGPPNAEKCPVSLPRCPS